MYYPTTRVLTVLELLQSRNRIGGAELAERLEVDVRTVRRYITMLQDLGIPVEGTRGRYGAYRLRPGFKLPPLMFSEDEALALVLGLLAARRLGLTLAAPATEGALAKVERVLPLALRERVRAVEETLVIEAGTRDVLPASGEIVVTLGTAAQQQRRIWLRYRAWEGEESERAMDPYGLVYRAGRWYVVGYCHLRDGVRVFRLDRMLSVELLADAFERPPSLNLLEHVERGIASVPSDWHVEALLHTTLDEARKRVAGPVAILEPVPDGEEGVLLRSYTHNLEWMAHYLMGLGCRFVVRNPPELRDALRQLAARTMACAEAI
ncbi:MAG: helix-turn-helix transcriptional regulator [Ktedonobacterales bacterium]